MEMKNPTLRDSGKTERLSDHKDLKQHVPSHMGRRQVWKGRKCRFAKRNGQCQRYSCWVELRRKKHHVLTLVLLLRQQVFFEIVGLIIAAFALHRMSIGLP